ncbi:hypothetical protein K432DRAFT_218818 [Lepidopterella palustris CBS 459.81]|uniref:Uncharacterized protein n=1 Tax=Lepidopterella palustris CBS 459.81 TaxID=1314670 RepID=A0A8E2J955_9PEZI|nr:hypothetical protein K432DRAFT_218818 [Lepidopterella palustris CBS 459.81]
MESSNRGRFQSPRPFTTPQRYSFFSVCLYANATMAASHSLPREECHQFQLYKNCVTNPSLLMSLPQITPAGNRRACECA